MKKMKKKLMIHAWHDEYLNMPLHLYDLSFDDGLSCQVKGVKKLIKKFPNIQIKFYISTFFINTNTKSKYSTIESDLAHAAQDLSNFITYDDLKYLSNLPNVVIGLHGHKHLDLLKIQRNFSIKNQYKHYKSDIDDMLLTAEQLLNFNILKKPYHFCMPYNQDIPLYRSMLRKYSNDNVIFEDLDRIDINTLDGAPSFFERYSNVLSEKQIKHLNSLTVEPKFYTSSELYNVK